MGIGNLRILTSGPDSIDGTSGDDWLYGAEGSDRLTGHDGADSIQGGDGRDTIDGGAGDDLLGDFSPTAYRSLGRGASFDPWDDSGNDEIHGGLGNDTLGMGVDDADSLFGGEGDDLFLLDGRSRLQSELGGLVEGGAGYDEFRFTHSVTSMGTITFVGVEVLRFDYHPTGYYVLCSLQQLMSFERIIGGYYFELRGAGGLLDLSVRTDGQDSSIFMWTLASSLSSAMTLVGTDYTDIVVGSHHNDTLFGNAGHDSLSGNAGGDDLRGGAGNDTLDGGADADTLTGGAGNDVYVVDSAADVIVEWADRGIDTMQVTTAGTWRIAANVENFSYRDAGKVTVTGNALDNVVLGGWGADTLSGWGGDDTLQGAAGRDRLYGNTGNDVLDGGLGSDTLTGGLGADMFVLAAAPGAGNIDTITDFSVADDTLRLAWSVFTTLTAGPLSADALLVTTPGGLFQAPGTATRLIYDSAAGTLSYDVDGSGTGASILIARLSPGLVLTAGDFVVV